MNVAILEIMNYKKQFQKTVSANLLVLHYSVLSNYKCNTHILHLTDHTMAEFMANKITICLI